LVSFFATNVTDMADFDVARARTASPRYPSRVEHPRDRGFGKVSLVCMK